MAYALTNLIIEENKRTIIDLLQSTHRKGMDNVIHYLNDSGFFIIPSSLHRHHNWCGGLAQHSLGVYMTARENSENLPKDSVIIACLLHDICKAGKYYYDFQYHYQLKYCDIVIRVFKDWLKIENRDNKNQWEFSIDLDKINNFSIEEKNNSYRFVYTTQKITKLQSSTSSYSLYTFTLNGYYAVNG